MANFYGFMLGFTNSIMFYATAAAFQLGGYLAKEEKFGMNFERIMLVFSCIIFGAQSVGKLEQQGCTNIDFAALAYRV